MRMKDLIDLVRAGLKPNEIKEMIEIEKQARDIDIDEPDSDDDDNVNKNTTDNNDVVNKDKDEDEMKKLSDALDAANNEISSLKNQITELQSSNRNKDMSGNSEMSIDDKITNIISEMY